MEPTKQTAIEAQLAAVMAAARETPGRTVTAYSPGDQAALQKLAEQKVAEAAKAAAEATAGISTETRQP